MNPNRKWIIAVMYGLLLLMSPIPAASEPCCIIVVPPPPSSPPPAAKETGIWPSIIPIYPQLPLFAAIEKKMFEASLKVEVRRKSFREALNMVHYTQGSLGLTTINMLARYKVATEADIEVAAVTINRPYYAVYALASHPAMLKDLKGKAINISGKSVSELVYTIKALRSAGISEKDVKFVSITAAGPPNYIEAARALKSGMVQATTGFVGYEAIVPEIRLAQIETPKTIMFPSWIIYANSRTLDKETKKVNQFIKGYTKGINVVKEDQQLVRRILEKQFNISNRKIQDKIVKIYIPLILPASIRPDPKEMKVTLEIISSVAKFKKAPVLLDEKRLQELYQ